MSSNLQVLLSVTGKSLLELSAPVERLLVFKIGNKITGSSSWRLMVVELVSPFRFLEFRGRI